MYSFLSPSTGLVLPSSFSWTALDKAVSAAPNSSLGRANNTEQGSKVGWKKITKACKLFLTNKNKKVIVKNKKPKITKDVKVVNGGFDAIDDFIIDNKFEKEMNNLNLSLQIKV